MTLYITQATPHLPVRSGTVTLRVITPREAGEIVRAASLARPSQIVSRVSFTSTIEVLEGLSGRGVHRYDHRRDKSLYDIKSGDACLLVHKKESSAHKADIDLDVEDFDFQLWSFSFE